MENDTCVSVVPGVTLYPSSSTCYKLVFDDRVYLSMWQLQIGSDQEVVAFCEVRARPHDFERRCRDDQTHGIPVALGVCSITTSINTITPMIPAGMSQVQ